MKYFIILLTSILLLSFKSDKLYNYDTENYEETINVFLERTKYKNILNNIAQFQVYKIETFDRNIDLNKYKIIHQIVYNAFEKNKFSKRFALNLKNRYDKNKIKEVIDWFSTPLGQKFTESEKNISSKEWTDEYLKFRKNINLIQIPKERISLIDKFAKSTQLEQNSIDTCKIFNQYHVKLYYLLNSGKNKRDLKSINKQISVSETKCEKQATESVQIEFLYRLRELSNPEIENLLKFIDSAEGRWFYSTIDSVFIELFRQTTKEAEKEFDKLIISEF